MRRDMIRFVAFDLILRITARGVMNIAFVIEVPAMDFCYRPSDVPSFRIPQYVIADGEGLHGDVLINLSG